MSTEPLHRAIQIIEQRTGLAVGSLLRADVSHIVARLSNGDIWGWLRLLETQPEDSTTWQQLLAALTIGETYFLRDPIHFKLLREKLLPPLIMQRRQANDLQLTILSVGCSSGEEPYSLAITMNEFLPDYDRWNIQVYGMDINAAALEQAQRARYRMWSFRHTNETFMRRYFTPGDETYDLRPEIKQRVTFVRGNLISPPPLPMFDVIFCRNILLYFTAKHVQIAEDNLYRALRPDGWLVLGGAEALRSRRDSWHINAAPNAPLYQKSRKRTTQPFRAVTTQTKSKPFLTTPVEQVDCDTVIKAIRESNLDHAERLLGQILMDAPRDVRANTLLAFIFANRKAYPEAQNHINVALSADPTSGDAHYLRGVIYNEQGDLATVERSMQSALYYQRNHLPSMLLLGTIYLQRGDIPKAHKLWHKARQIAAQHNDEEFMSDFSEMSIEQYVSLLNSQLDD